MGVLDDHDTIMARKMTFLVNPSICQQYKLVTAGERYFLAVLIAEYMVPHSNRSARRPIQVLAEKKLHDLSRQQIRIPQEIL